MPEPRKISFRATLKGEISDFIERAGMACVDTTSALVELVVELSHYEEEGTVLYPKILVCDALARALALLQGTAPLEIGRGPKDASTVKQALKKCAPLARQGWVVYVERGEREFSYGVFREPELPTALDIRNTLGALPVDSVKAVLARQIAERVVELVTTGERHLHVHLSAASADEPPPGASIDKLVSAAVVDAPEFVRESLRSYLSSVIGRALLHGHGALLAVVRVGSPIPSPLSVDGVLLVEPIQLAGLVEVFLREQSTEAVLTLSAYGALLEGMLGSDGITLLRSDGTILGYNFFVQRSGVDGTPASQMLGGARRRAFEALSRFVESGDVACAFIRSSNGSSGHKIGAPA
ncbi:hypothetical protein [Sorangium sp. So ce204]|uniref:hypothetical protein n=1 Tax=Sorangium sp. So ce204 TaxID=3133288 RepID=UPI003F5DCCC1